MSKDPVALIKLTVLMYNLRLLMLAAIPRDSTETWAPVTYSSSNTKELLKIQLRSIIPAKKETH